MSSPRERGSSAGWVARQGRPPVVPARAGVIPRRAGSRSGTWTSSPRERGSSEAALARDVHPYVVPARAGVIRPSGFAAAEAARRPRASGGHPADATARLRERRSSPRERGSSVGHPLQRGRRVVVPARAGVILHLPPVWARAVRRPRASGGHPRGGVAARRWRWSSPRERGSSGRLLRQLDPEGVVPARAGVIRECGWSLGASRCRPRASGGHPGMRMVPRCIEVSSPRERGSSGM